MRRPHPETKWTADRYHPITPVDATGDTVAFPGTESGWEVDRNDQAQAILCDTVEGTADSTLAICHGVEP